MWMMKVEKESRAERKIGRMRKWMKQEVDVDETEIDRNIMWMEMDSM